jgi:hypothetical protein
MSRFSRLLALHRIVDGSIGRKVAVRAWPDVV